MDQGPFIYRVVTVTLATVIVAVAIALLYGLYDPKIDNDKVFAIIGPAFNTVIGAFVGIVAGRALGDKRLDR